MSNIKSAADMDWRTPPSRTELGKTYDAQTEQLKRFPGRWARVITDQNHSNAPSALVRRGCQVTCRPVHTDDKPTWDVYARWPASSEYPEWEPATRKQSLEDIRERRQ